MEGDMIATSLHPGHFFCEDLVIKFLHHSNIEDLTLMVISYEIY